MTKRKGAPPLRFKGRELVRIEHAFAGGAASITLWERKTRGYVASVEVGHIVDSASSDTLDDTMCWLEEVCERSSPTFAQTTINDFLSRTPDAFTASHSLRILIGEALDQWDRLPGH